MLYLLGVSFVSSWAQLLLRAWAQLRRRRLGQRTHAQPPGQNPSNRQWQYTFRKQQSSMLFNIQYEMWFHKKLPRHVLPYLGCMLLILTLYLPMLAHRAPDRARCLVVQRRQRGLQHKFKYLCQTEAFLINLLLYIIKIRPRIIPSCKVSKLYNW